MYPWLKPVLRLANHVEIDCRNYPEDGIAEIYFSFRERHFPEEHWTDFKRVLLVWRSALSEDGSDGMLFFMDGPYHFDVQKMDRETFLFGFHTNVGEEGETVVRYVATRQEYEAVRRQLATFAKHQ